MQGLDIITHAYNREQNNGVVQAFNNRSPEEVLAEAKDRALTSVLKGWGINRLWLTMQAMGLDFEAEKKYLNSNSIPVKDAEKMSAADWFNVVTGFGESFKGDLYALRDIRQADMLWVKDQARKAGILHKDNPKKANERIRAVSQVIAKDFKDPDLIKELLVKHYMFSIMYPHITDEQRLQQEQLKNMFNYQNLFGEFK